MAANLRDRLKRIQELKKSEAAFKTKSPSCSDVSPLTRLGWEDCGFKVMKREVFVDSPLKSIVSLPASLTILVPDLAGKELPSVRDFVFFDLETIGLSTGAGTIAFLAAFGKPYREKLRITQYLLLDYPGENDFLDAVLSEFKNEKSVITSYNGKCFDSQIIKTMCLMNRKKPPVYFHVDLLHPSRRLWKRIIGDCSQGSVEARILGISRENDIPGALAPEIWFEFLKTGKTERLSGICDHNIADISGLSSILNAIISIASDPLGCERISFDIERLALCWRGFLRRNSQEKLYMANGNLRKNGDELLRRAQESALQITGGKLLRLAAEKKYPRAALIYAQDRMRDCDCEKGREMLIEISESGFPVNIKMFALRSLAIDSERRLKCPQEALEFTIKGLALELLSAFWRNEFEKRKKRLERILFENSYAKTQSQSF